MAIPTLVVSFSPRKVVASVLEFPGTTVMPGATLVVPTINTGGTLLSDPVVELSGAIVEPGAASVKPSDVVTSFLNIPVVIPVDDPLVPDPSGDGPVVPETSCDGPVVPDAPDDG